MIKTVLLFSTFFMMVNAAFAQGQLTKQWDNRFGGSGSESIYCISPTADGGCILGGSSSSDLTGDKSQASMGSSDYWIVKVDANGNKQWDKTFGSGSADLLGSVHQTRDGGYILGGYTNAGATGDKTEAAKGSYDYWIVRTDALGNLLWEKSFGGSNADYCYAVCQTTDGGFVAGGSSSSPISGDKTQDLIGGGSDYWIVKIDSLGNKVWDKQFGSTVSDAFTSIRETADGGVIMGGYTTGGLGGDKSQASRGGIDFWVVKTDHLGIKQWDSRAGGSGSDRLFSLDVTKDGGYILGGLTSSDVGGDKIFPLKGGIDFWMVKLDALGGKVWDRDFGGTNSEDDFGNIMTMADGGFLLSGSSYSNIGGDKTENNTLNTEQTWVVRTNALGVKLWDKTVNTASHEEIEFAVQTLDGCYVITNQSGAGIAGDKTQTSRGGSDYWAIKFCDTVAVSVLLPVSNFQTTDTALCSSDCITYTNLSSNATTYQWSFPGGMPAGSTDPNPFVCYLSAGVYNVTLVATNTSGSNTLTLNNYIDVKNSPPTPVITQVDTILYCSTDPTYTAYQWYDDNTLIPGATDTSLVISHSGNYNVQVSNENDCKIAVGINVILGLQNYMRDQSAVLFPNPAKDRLTVSGLQFPEAKLEIYNVLGVKVRGAGHETVNQKQETVLDVSGLSAGIYLLLITGSAEHVVMRFAKE